jgi:thiamine biosynthesis lipoprotein
VIEVSITEMIVPDLHRRAKVPAREHRSDDTGEAAGWASTWPAWGTTASVTVTDPAALAAARRLVSRQFGAAEKAAGRFRKDAELHRLYRAGGRPITVSPLLAELIGAALTSAERTGGDVDPTVAAAMTAIHGPARQNHEFSSVPVCGSRPTEPRPVTGWEQVHLCGRQLRVPAGTTLDLSATATAFACDRAASAVRARLNVGVLVTLGGDAASAGPGPDGGWRLTVDDPGGDRIPVRLPAGTALATSHFTARPDLRVNGGTRPGHLIDPRTGRAPTAIWRMASAIGFTSLEASTYTAATLIRGTAARGWLGQLGVPARLVTVQEDVITVGPWSAHQVGAPDHSLTSRPADGTGDPARFPSPRSADSRRTTR